MTDLGHVLLTNAGVVTGLMVFVWTVSLLVRDVSIVDIAWGSGFVLIGWTTFFVTSSAGPTRWELLVLVTIWGLRLAGYLAWRNIGQPEDKRYARMRQRWGPSFPLISLLTVFGLQAVIMWTVSLPIQLGIAQSFESFNGLHAIGLAAWTVGMFFESVGDWQLARFKHHSNEENAVLDRGLWRYTRHPNYFGDFCVWWGHFIVAIAGGANWWTIIGPVVMSVLLMYVSGVTLLERDLKTRKPEYQAYVERTNTFFPWFPKQNL
ncbi:MAG: DUF1295 domain-containing protein [Planctomycetaceae bacterium]|nr:DUF1295 domain-containing protein [Planctomycetaceae bacterium]